MKVNLLIIGAGPAGMAALTQANELGLSVALLDEQPRLGGQIYRNISQPSMANQSILGSDYYKGNTLIPDLTSQICHYLPNSTVWQIEPDGQVLYSQNGIASCIYAEHILIATGAQERPFPIPGWTLPGVMTAGSAQIMLKNSGIAAEGAVFAGSGPLLYLIVSQYIRAGIEVKAILDTTPIKNYRKAFKQIKGAFKGWRYTLKGIQLLREIKASGVTHIHGVTNLEAIGDKKNGLQQVAYNTKYTTENLLTSHLFLHQGVVPSTNLAMSCDCHHHWNEQQLCWQPTVDSWGQSSRNNISIAGDGGGIAGAVAAALSGQIAILHIAVLQGKIHQIERNNRAAPLIKKWKKEKAFRPFIDSLYRPSDHFRKPVREDVIICRCEETSLADIKHAAAFGCPGPNQLKSYTRCGMGLCQGRQCSLTVTELMAEHSGLTVNESGHYRVRAPIKPITMDELASLADTNTTLDCIKDSEIVD
jgi:NADPH-dependent 2,4-dienoyl-CoA reductase/sulfur reductase-like enzyme